MACNEVLTIKHKNLVVCRIFMAICFEIQLYNQHSSYKTSAPLPNGNMYGILKSESRCLATTNIHGPLVKFDITDGRRGRVQKSQELDEKYLAYHGFFRLNPNEDHCGIYMMVNLVNHNHNASQLNPHFSRSIPKFGRHPLHPRGNDAQPSLRRSFQLDNNTPEVSPYDDYCATAPIHNAFIIEF